MNAKRLSVERQLPTEEIDYAALGYFSDTEGFLLCRIQFEFNVGLVAELSLDFTNRTLSQLFADL